MRANYKTFRVYVLLTSLDPLRAYIYDEGLGITYILNSTFFANEETLTALSCKKFLTGEAKLYIPDRYMHKIFNG